MIWQNPFIHDAVADAERPERQLVAWELRLIDLRTTSSSGEWNLMALHEGAATRGAA